MSVAPGSVLSDPTLEQLCGCSGRAPGHRTGLGPGPGPNTQDGSAVQGGLEGQAQMPEPWPGGCPGLRASWEGGSGQQSRPVHRGIPGGPASSPEILALSTTCVSVAPQGPPCPSSRARANRSRPHGLGLSPPSSSGTGSLAASPAEGAVSAVDI